MKGRWFGWLWLVLISMTSIFSWLGKSKLGRNQARSLAAESSLPLEEVESTWKTWVKEADNQSKLTTKEEISNMIQKCNMTPALLRLRNALCGRAEEDAPIHVDVIARDDADLSKTVGLELAEMVLKMFDLDGDNCLDFREFLIGMACLSNGTPADKAELQFRVMDLDGNQYITHDEAVTMVRTITISFKLVAFYEIRKKLLSAGLDAGLVDEIEKQVGNCWESRTSDHSELYANELLRVADVDADGRVSLEEYVSWQCDEEKRRQFFQIMSDELKPVETRFQISLQDCIQEAFLNM